MHVQSFAAPFIVISMPRNLQKQSLICFWSHIYKRGDKLIKMGLERILRFICRRRWLCVCGHMISHPMSNQMLTMPCNQVEAHPFWRNDRLLSWCRTKGIHMTAYSPLGSPDSAALFRRNTKLLLEDSTVQSIAVRNQKDAGQVRTHGYPPFLDDLRFLQC